MQNYTQRNPNTKTVHPSPRFLLLCGPPISLRERWHRGFDRCQAGSAHRKGREAKNGNWRRVSDSTASATPGRDLLCIPRWSDVGTPRVSSRRRKMCNSAIAGARAAALPPLWFSDPSTVFCFSQFLLTLMDSARDLPGDLPISLHDGREDRSLAKCITGTFLATITLFWHSHAKNTAKESSCFLWPFLTLQKMPHLFSLS